MRLLPLSMKSVPYSCPGCKRSLVVFGWRVPIHKLVGTEKWCKSGGQRIVR